MIFFHESFSIHFTEAMTNSVDGLWKVKAEYDRKFITLLFFVLKVFELLVILFAIKTSNFNSVHTHHIKSC